jgi:hypothetical protein
MKYIKKENELEKKTTLDDDDDGGWRGSGGNYLMKDFYYEKWFGFYQNTSGFRTGVLIR